MRTAEVILVILILLGTFLVVLHFAVLPSPRVIFGSSLQELASSTLETLDANGDLSRTVFNSPSDPSWGDLQRALSASLPPNLVYNLSAYELLTSPDGVVTYSLVNSLSNSEGNLGAGSEASSYLVTSSNVTFTVTPEKIGESERKPRTLYILSCSDANGWWITGYTGQTLASDLYNLLSPYFETTVFINTTDQLGLLLDNSPEIGGTIQGAVVINTFGESVPIPTAYCRGYPRASEGYDSVHDSYARYCHTLGVRTRQYDWTWVSIVGYPLYYGTNTVTFWNRQNGWGMYGMVQVGAAGLNAFLQGIDNKAYSYNNGWITESPGVVEFSSEALDLSNYYGIYPAPYQTSTRALPSSILSTYHLTATEIFNRPPSPYANYIAGATYRHTGGGALTAIGLTRITDIRVTALALLMYYRPKLYRSEFGTERTSRLVVLQLGQQGGV